MWAKLNHDLLYKSSGRVPKGLKRAMARAKALTELIDSEVSGVRRAIVDASEAPQWRTLTVLEKVFQLFAPGDYRRELSLDVLEQLPGELFPADIDKSLRAFVEEKREALSYIYERRNELCFPFLTQPESLLVLMLIDRDAYSMQASWPTQLERRCLFELAPLLGHALDDSTI